MATEMERMIFRLMGDASSFHRMIEDVKKATKAMVVDLQALGSSVSRAISAPLAAIGDMSTKAFASFDQAMTETFAKMGKQTPELRKEMEEVAKSLSMSGVVAFSPTELARAYEEMAGAGLQAAESIKALPIVAKFAQAGAFNTSTAVEQLTQAMASYGVTMQTVKGGSTGFAKEMNHFANVMANVANTTPATVEQVSRAFSSDSAVQAKRYGMNIEELGAILGVYAQQGRKGEEAGNMMGRATRLLTSAFTEHRKEWKRLGVDIEDVTTGKFIPFADAIEQIEVAFKDVQGPARTALLDKLGIEALSQRALEPLIGQSKELRRLGKSYGKLTTINEMSGTQMESFSNSMKVVSNSIEVVGIDIGKTLAPSLRMVGEAIKSVTIWWGNLNNPIKNTVIAIASVATLIGPFILTVSGLSLAFKGITLVVLSAASALKAFGLALFTTPTGLIVLGLAAAYIAADTLITKLEKVNEVRNKLISTTAKELDQHKRMTFEIDLGTDKTMMALEGIMDLAERSKEYERAISNAKQNLISAKFELRDLKKMAARGGVDDAALKLGQENIDTWVRQVDRLTQAAVKLGKIDTKTGLSALLIANINDFNTKLREQIATLGMSEDAIALYNFELNKGVQKAKEFAEATDLVNRKLEKQLELDIDEAIKQGAKDIISIGRTSREAALAIFAAKDTGRKSTDSLRILKDQNDMQTELEHVLKLKEKAKELKKDLQGPQEKSAEVKKELDEMYLRNIINAEEYSRAIRKNIADLNELKNTTFEYARVNSAEAKTRLANWRDSMRFSPVKLPDKTNSPYAMSANNTVPVPLTQGNYRAVGGMSKDDEAIEDSVVGILRSLRDMWQKYMQNPPVNVKPSGLKKP